MHDLQDREVVTKLFDTHRAALRDAAGRLYAPAAASASARATAPRSRRSELVGSEFDPQREGGSATRRPKPKPKAKGVGGRLRAAAERLRGKKDDAGGDGGKKQSAEAVKRRHAARRPRREKQAGDLNRYHSPAESQRYWQARNSLSPQSRELPEFGVVRGTSILTLLLDLSPARAAFAAAMIFVCRCAGTSS